MEAQEANRVLVVTANHTHLWRRVRELEEGLSIVVYVRSCDQCGQIEAKAGHRNASSPEDWELIEPGVRATGSASLS
jgi:hypothetical protein